MTIHTTLSFSRSLTPRLPTSPPPTTPTTRTPHPQSYSSKQHPSQQTAPVPVLQACDVTALVAVQAQVTVLQKAQAMLSCHLELDSWAEIWAAADGQQAFDATTSRVAHAMTAHVIGDLLPNFAYCEPTHRFARMVSFYGAASACCAVLCCAVLQLQYAVLCSSTCGLGRSAVLQHQAGAP